MDALCRICLEQLQGKFKVPLTENIKGITVFKYINLITNIQIKENDGLPTCMCFTCYKEFETVLSFKEKCETSNSKLRELSQIEIKDAIEYECEIKQETIDYPDVLSNYSDDEPELSFKAAIPTVCDDNQESIPNITSYNNLSSNMCNLDIKNQTKKKYKEIYECDDCGQVFKSKCKIAVHWKKNHLLMNLICLKCKKDFKSFQAFKNHKGKSICKKLDDKLIDIEGIGKNRVFKCKECSHATKNGTHMIVHVRSHTGDKPYKCPDCPSSFRQSATLLFHQDCMHKKSSLPKLKCPICNKVIQGRRHLRNHINYIHKAPIVHCPICNISLFKRSLKLHMARHSDSKNFTCEICASPFYSLGELLNHKRKVHEKNKNIKYQCEQCPYKTYCTDLLKKHIEKHNNGSFFCSICYAFYKEEDKYLKHQQLHEVEKKFQCPYCDLKYRTLKSQKKHTKTKHTSTIFINSCDTQSVIKNDSKAKIIRTDSKQIEINIGS